MLVFQRYTWWLGAMVGLALLLAVAGQVGALGPVQGLFVRATSPVESALSGVFQPVATLLSDAGRLRSLEEENSELRLEVEALRNENTQLRQDAAEVEALREALNVVGAAEDQSFEAASVVSRDASSFTDVVHINKGSDAGLEPGMVVLSTEGSLVGTVTDVLPTRASVRLISDSRSAVNARVLETDIDGSVRGSPTKTVHLELARGNINEGDEIVTSGVGANYPPGLPVGIVSNVEGTPQDMFLQVTIDPHVRLATLRTVLVNTSFDPSREQLE